ncbi:MAG: DUF285 domain-containing protein, partial [Ekhidna sp.]|nr:DUF285 domain-containing protein [Ekhidna sp.]
MREAFAGCNNLSIDEDAGTPNLSNVTDMFGMFANSIFNGDISEWDVSSVTDMSYMFASGNPAVDISEWNTGSVTNMFAMFFMSPFNGDLSKWDVSKVTNMAAMFNGTSFNGDLSKWDVSKVINMNGMFAVSSFNGDLSKWDVSKVINMTAIFQNSSFNQDIGNWDISNVTNMERMFTSNTSMSSENYDKLLIGWSTKTPEETRIPSGITFGAPDKYSCRGKAGRDALTGAPHSWKIKGDELISIRTDAASLSEVTAPCEVTANDLTAPTAESSCTIGAGETVTAAHDVSEFPITESTLVTWTYTHNSKSIVQTQTVTIDDTTPPIVTGSLAAVTAQCPISAENELTKPDAPADNCGGTVNVAIKTGTTFPLTESGTITWVYTDESGNTSEQTQDVTIEDTMKPTVTDLNAITAACSLAEADLPEPTATDNCDEG